MKVTICVFAGLKNYFDSEFNLELDSNYSIDQVMGKLQVMNPLSKSVLSICRFAVNDSFVSSGYVLQNEERLCIIPPSSGG
jgi:sulfur-carrier protein